MDANLYIFYYPKHSDHKNCIFTAHKVTDEGRNKEGTAAAEKSETPTLDKFSRDLTKLATTGKIDPVIGRSDEITRVIQILSRRKKNNPVLIGEPGVGKTAISAVLCHRFPEVKAYHLVMSDDLRKSDALECVLSIAYQLSTQILEYADRLLEINFNRTRFGFHLI